MEKQKLNISYRCSEVTLDEFIDCAVNGNYKRLVRSGDPDNDEVVQAWEKLYNEYSELSGNTWHSYLFSLVKAITMLTAKLQAAELLLKFNESKAVELLKKFGYRGVLKNMIATMKRESIDLQNRNNELAAIQKNQQESSGEQEFTAWIIAVSRFQGYSIDRKTIILSDFLEMSKQMHAFKKGKP